MHLTKIPILASIAGYYNDNIHLSVGKTCSYAKQRHFFEYLHYWIKRHVQGFENKEDKGLSYHIW